MNQITKTDYDLPDADVIYYPDFFDKETADHYFNAILKKTSWRQDNVKIFGKTFAQPRLTSFIGDDGKKLSYSGISMDAQVWTDDLLKIRKEINHVVDAEFNSVLLNLYRTGLDSNGWHADNEKYLGRNPVIASVSFGAERSFHLKHNSLDIPTTKILLRHGSLLIMSGTTQHFWKHQIPKSKNIDSARINLTYRFIY